MNFRFDNVPPVRTSAGLVHGYCQDEMFIFKGVPYAEAERFHAPHPPTPWEGVRDTTSYGFVCPLMDQDTPKAELMVPHRYWPMDENCQNLNIWTDSLGSDAKRPVLVWIHGGGFTAGSSIEQVAYDGFNMCRNGSAVVVSLNHRLNLLGYLDLSPYGEQYANSANAGHADLVAALEWIRENIAAFGGDPDNVTIFGQSGGGMKVTGLMQIPAADGLFHRAIVMSGVSDGSLLPEPKGDGTKLVEALLAELGLPAGAAQELQKVPYSALAAAYKKVSMPLMMAGEYTGCAPMPNEFYMGEPLIHGYTEHAKTIPLLVGSVYGEFAFMPDAFDKKALSHEDAMGMIAEQYGEDTAKAVELFQKAYPKKALTDLLSLDRVFRVPSKRLAALHAQAGGKAYLYNFIPDFPIWNSKPAWHCADIPFVFCNADLVEVCGFEGAKELQQQIFGAVMAFARTGDPNHAGLPQWNCVTDKTQGTMVFDLDGCSQHENYDDELLELMNRVLPPFNIMAILAQDVQH